ncbi:cupin domain-containing protein [Sphingosinicella soli]|uniref:Anti-sigma factor ChrR (Cupin superfamily) n=1 Tax=Sphingosinicella soli TaxID=333708 RepID=A0A7W7F7H4_9SPHN|nr:cupin domain-containing protein [Sphingosinicella soli]MBB4632659.1 anti-sigma factor ChrR (cupin superfamily) [Sphingosinicella soli]
MPLPQEITPLNDQLADTVVATGNMEWLETVPGAAWIKVLWTGAESGGWAAIFRWKKGYVAGPHKHLSAAHVLVLKGKLQVRDGVLNTGDYVYEPNGMLHGATTALEDTEYLFVCNGPLIFHDDNSFTSYLGWEELEKMRTGALSGAAISAGAKVLA